MHYQTDIKYYKQILNYKENKKIYNQVEQALVLLLSDKIYPKSKLNIS